jgi:sugar-specific transcriptional regulator TrmB
LSVSEIIDNLVSFGLTPLQSLSYATLVREGRLPASTLAQIIEIDRSDAYRVLRSLVRLGMVEIELEDKSYYCPVPPSRALLGLLQAKESDIMELREKRKVLSELLEISKIQKMVNPPKKDPFFRLVSGNQVFTRWAEAILNAKSSVIKVIPGYTLPAHYVRLSDIEAEAAKRVNVTIVTEVTDQNVESLKEYYSKIRILHADGLASSFRYLIVDHSEVFMGGTPMTDSIEDHVVIWTNNTVFVEACVKDFENLLKRSKDANEVIRKERKAIAREA